MKRLEVNALMQWAVGFMRANHFHLLPFASWTVEDWKEQGPESSEVVEQQLGWDITDFGSGDFNSVGLLVFTLRNGTFEELKKPLGKI
jgi:D-lyxose ketol-isomerase